jgi:hypothetical protein
MKLWITGQSQLTLPGLGDRHNCMGKKKCWGENGNLGYEFWGADVELGDDVTYVM